MNAAGGAPRVRLVDAHGLPLGVEERTLAHAGEGLLHLAFTVVLVAPPDRVLLARRAATKPLWPDHVDATVASHPLPDEAPDAAAARRVREELGLDVTPVRAGAFRYHARDVAPDGSLRGSEREHCEVFVARAEAPAAPDPHEVSRVESVPLAALLETWAGTPGDVCPWAPLALLVAREALPHADLAAWQHLAQAVRHWPGLVALP